LAVQASTDIAHGRLRLSFTVDEETGLTGAQFARTRLYYRKHFAELGYGWRRRDLYGCAVG
jgi:putative aminopeptidase FrvX